MYIRKKKIKGKEYAYAVKSIWTKNGPRQRVAKYLGSVVKISAEKTVGIPLVFGDLDSFLQNSKREQFISKLIELELLRAGFQREGNTLKKDGITVNGGDYECRTADGKRVVLEINEGFICNYTLQLLLSFKGKGQGGVKLATLLIGAGINLPKELFVRMYERYYS